MKTRTWIMIAAIVVLLGYVVYLLIDRNDDSTQEVVKTELLEKDASSELKNSEELIEKNPGIITVDPNSSIKATPIASLMTIKNIDKVMFTGDAGFTFLETTRGNIPIFYFKEDLVEKAGRTGVVPQLYKPKDGQGTMDFNKRGEYYYVIDDGKKIVLAPGNEALITGNAYLGIKPNGHEAWLAYELEAQGYAEVNGTAKLWYNEKTKGTDFATLIKGYKFLY